MALKKAVREATIEKKVVEYAKKSGWLVWKFVSPANMAVPDRIFIRNSIVFFIEFKKPGALPTKLQTKILKDLNNHQVPAFVIDDLQKGIDLIDSFKE